jgi:hypothetical protein
LAAGFFFATTFLLLISVLEESTAMKHLLGLTPPHSQKQSHGNLDARGQV